MWEKRGGGGFHAFPSPLWRNIYTVQSVIQREYTLKDTPQVRNNFMYSATYNIETMYCYRNDFCYRYVNIKAHRVVSQKVTKFIKF